MRNNQGVHDRGVRRPVFLSPVAWLAALSRARNVFKRAERLQILKENERWDEEQSVFGLPKVRTRFKSVVAKKKKREEDDAEAKKAEEATSTEKR